ncbi:MAG: type II secretion system protein [Candidatus Omnitrophota bacterium]|nr:type II secretion system protein [Candidatus Omnitrophota bacterium]
MKSSGSRGFTLVELLIAVLISSIIASTVVLMLASSLEVWRFGNAQLSIDKVNQTILGRIVEGTFQLQGLRDAMEIYRASANEIVFVPLQKDTRILEYSISGGDKIFLQRQFKAGTNKPIVEARLPAESAFSRVSTVFYYGKEIGPERLDDYVIVKQSLPIGTELKFTYHPDPGYGPEVRMRYFWDTAEKKLYYVYQGIITEVPVRNPDVEIEGIEFFYFANANAPILPSDTNLELSTGQLKRITAVKIIVVSRKEEEVKEAVSFVNIRNLSNRGSGIIITEGSEIGIPDSDNIKALSLVNINGAHQGDEIVLEISSKRGKTWKITIEFGSPPEEIEFPEVKIKGYKIEYPEGKIVFNQEAYSSLKNGVSFLNMGNDLYDYDNDPNIEDIVYYKGEGIKLKVVKMNVDAAAIAVQP